MAQQGAMFQELSSRLATSQTQDNEKPTSPKLNDGQSPQLPKKPPKSPAIDKSRSSTTGKGKKVRINVDEDKRQTIGAIPSETDGESPKKKHGVWKGIKRFFGKKKDRAGNSKSKSNNDDNISGQMRAKSESELPYAVEAGGKGSYGKMKNSRYSWSEGLENSDGQRSGEYGNDRQLSSPSDEETGNDKIGGGLPKKIRDSFRNRFKLKRRKSDISSDASDGSPADAIEESSGNPASNENLSASFFDDSFYTASLSPIAEAGAVSNSDVQLDELPSLQDTSQLSTSSAARHKMQIAPKARRKPARFRNRRDDTVDGTPSEKAPSAASSSTSIGSESVRKNSHLESAEKLNAKNIKVSPKSSKVHLNDRDTQSTEVTEEIRPVSLSLEHLPTKDLKKPVPAPRPRPKSLGPGLLLGENEPKPERIIVDVTVKSSPAMKRKELPKLPQAKSAGDISVKRRSMTKDASISPAKTPELLVGDVEVIAGGEDALAITPQSVSSDWEHIEAATTPSDEPETARRSSESRLSPRKNSPSERTERKYSESNNFTRSRTASDIIARKRSDSRTSSGHLSESEPSERTYSASSSTPKDDRKRDTPRKESSPSSTERKNVEHTTIDDIIVPQEQIRNNSTGEYMNLQPHLAKNSEFARKHPPPDTSVLKVSSPKLQHSAEVSSIRSSMRANSDANQQATSPVYDKPAVTFQKRQWNSMKTRKAEMVDLRSMDIETEVVSPTRSYSVSSNYKKGMKKSQSTDHSNKSDGEESETGKNVPEWIKIARLKHKKIVGDENEEEEEQSESEETEVTAPIPPVKPSGLLTT